MTGQLPNNAKKKGSAKFLLIPFLIIIALWVGNYFFLYRSGKLVPKNELEVKPTQIPEDAVYDEHGNLLLNSRGEPITEKDIKILKYAPQHAVTVRDAYFHTLSGVQLNTYIPRDEKVYHTKRKEHFVFCYYNTSIPDSGWISINDVK